jgi:hypothetical protein
MFWATLKSVKPQWRVLLFAGVLLLLFLVPQPNAANPPCPASPIHVGPPTNKEQCKNGGWQNFNVPRCFKNQGDCVSFVETGH